VALTKSHELNTVTAREPHTFQQAQQLYETRRRNVPGAQGAGGGGGGMTHMSALVWGLM
jgi:hypothetical protein